MDTKLIAKKLALKIKKQNILSDVPMGEYTSIKCGGNVALLVICESFEDLSYTLSLANAFSEEVIVLGNGSNTIFRDGYIEKIVVKLAGEFSEIILNGDEMVAGSAALLPFVAKIAAANSLSGLEAVSGIPGSVGGAIFMNAGAYEHSIKEVLKTVTAVTKDGEIYEYDADELKLSYRHSLFMENGNIILSCKMKLCPGDMEKIQESMKEYAKIRKEKQPISYTSCGSFFKRPEGNFAGALIEEAGLKGKRIGGACVSELHAGFLINEDHASASDVLLLKDFVISAVKEKFGVSLEPEVRIIE